MVRARRDGFRPTCVALVKAADFLDNPSNPTITSDDEMLEYSSSIHSTRTTRGARIRRRNARHSPRDNYGAKGRGERVFDRREFYLAAESAAALLWP